MTTAIVQALETLKARADLAILAIRRGDREAAAREIDVAADELRGAMRDEEPDA